MIKQLSTIIVLFMSILIYAQGSDKDTYKGHKDRWEVFGAIYSINFDNTASVNVQDNINIGLQVGVSRAFKNNFFLAAGANISTIRNAGLWENPVDYISFNVEGGYRIQTGGLTEGVIAIGSSYINAINTLPDAESSFSANIKGGFIFWLNDSNWGLTIADTYKFVNSDFMVSHNQITVGTIYKF
ncbi:hypothetical protein [Polaribacter aestuariivivens]|uniref:hypothetical protein n=1 Tax=Polaribacter aestuariivivens TaxID=2304626 RepID=UPI003F496755